MHVAIQNRLRALKFVTSLSFYAYIVIETAVGIESVQLSQHFQPASDRVRGALSRHLQGTRKLGARINTKIGYGSA